MPREANEEFALKEGEFVMKKMLVLAALASTLCVAPALAQNMGGNGQAATVKAATVKAAPVVLLALSSEGDYRFWWWVERVLAFTGWSDGAVANTRDVCRRALSSRKCCF
jgi:hypothetical protein